MKTRVALIAAFLAAAVPASAGAAVTVGSNLAATAAQNFPGTTTGVNLGLPAASLAPGGLAVPSDGVVVRWSVKSGSAGNTLRLRVLRQVSGVSFLAAGTSGPGTTTAATDTFPARLPVRAGDFLGLDVGNDALVWSTNATASAAWWSAPPVDGTTTTATATNRELLLQAVVEPDADRDGYGDETQDGCPADPLRSAPPCATAPAPGTTGSGTPRDTTRPTVTRLAVTPRSFRRGAGARIVLGVSERARVTLVFSALVPGRRSAGRCVRARHTGRRCTRVIAVGTTTLRTTGTARVRFDGRVEGRRLAPGRYRVRATAIDDAGNVSRVRDATFRVRTSG